MMSDYFAGKAEELRDLQSAQLSADFTEFDKALAEVYALMHGRQSENQE